MPPRCGCGQSFGHRRSAFGSSADSFFHGMDNNKNNYCLQANVYYRNNVTPLTHASGFGKKSSFGNGPMKIGSKKNKSLS